MGDVEYQNAATPGGAEAVGVTGIVRGASDPPTARLAFENRDNRDCRKKAIEIVTDMQSTILLILSRNERY